MPSDRDRKDDGDLADLGILLVHGIGHSRRADTLVRFGEPLVKWIVDWVGERRAAEVEVLDAVLVPSGDGGGELARTRLRVTAPAQESGDPETSEWLIAESWWAESFVTPSFNDLANWGFKVVPWTVFFHFHRRFTRASSALRKAWSHKPRSYRALLFRGVALVREMVVLMVALLLAPVLVAALGLIVVLGLIPIPQLRSMVGWLQRGLALTVGDSFALLGPRIGSAAIYSRVARDLKWLSGRSRKVAVVAHSQGAAVAYRVVAQDDSEKVGLLVTFGAGLRKLTQIRLLEQSREGWVLWVSLALVSLVVAAMVSRETLGAWRGLLLAVLVPAIWFGGAFVVGIVLGIVRRIPLFKKKKASPARSTRFQMVLGFFMIGATTALIAWQLPGESLKTTVWVTLLVSFSWNWLIRALQVAGADAKRIAVMTMPAGRPKPAEEDALPEAVRWIDIYSASDPVPNGPIYDGQPLDPLQRRSEVEGLESIEVRNRGSALSDHTSYWENPEGFVASVAGALGELCGLSLEEVLPLDRHRLTVARHRRAWRLRWLRGARRATLVMAVAVWWLGDTLQYSGELFDRLLDALRSILWLGSLLGLALPETAPRSTFTEVLGVAVAAAMALGLIGLAWHRWDSADLRSLTRRKAFFAPGKDGTQPAVLFHFAWLVSVLSGVCVIFGWIWWPWWAYLLALLAVFLAAALVTGLDPCRGEIAATWPGLLRRLGLWTPQAKEEWEQDHRAGSVGYIDLIALAGEAPTWDAGLTLIGHPVSISATDWFDTYRAATLREATEWSLERADSVLARVGNQGDYLPVAELLSGSVDQDRAIRLWSEVIESERFSPVQRAEGRVNRAHCEGRVGRWDRALEDYAAAIDSPATTVADRSSALNERGFHYQEVGEFDKAIHDLTAVVELPEAPQEEVARAYAVRGWTLYGRGDLAGFLADAAQSVYRAPHHIMMALNFGLATLLQTGAVEALELYRVTAEECPDPDALREALVDLEKARSESAEPLDVGAIQGVIEKRLADLEAGSIAEPSPAAASSTAQGGIAGATKS